MKFILIFVILFTILIATSYSQTITRRRTCHWRPIGSECGSGYRCIDKVCIPCPRRARCQYRCGRNFHCICGECIRRSFGVYRLSPEQRRRFLSGSN